MTQQKPLRKSRGEQFTEIAMLERTVKRLLSTTEIMLAADLIEAGHVRTMREGVELIRSDLPRVARLLGREATFDAT